MTRALASLAASAVVLVASSALAQPPDRFGQTFRVGPTEVDVVSTWRGRRSGVSVVTPAGSRAVHTGRPAYAFAAAGQGGVLVALVGAGAGVEVVFVRTDAGRPTVARRADLPRIAGADRSPVGASVAARPDGFAVFWQEASATNPNQPYQTFLARLDPTGRPTGATVEVPAPWPLADTMWVPEERRYYFLLFYGDGRSTRLCGVHVDGATLRPVEHPWWASPAGMIDEARLARRGPRVLAVYRDGANLRESDVTTGGWSQEPAPARDHGRISPAQTFVTSERDGALAVRIRALR